ncbi:MAG: 50S ribosomal protein L3 [Chlamydiae bacterium]|nr:50S ribosomal protein L3 [Chlamydiota bacterium]
MARKLMGKKRGMMQLFDDNGNVVVCTVIEAEPNVVTQIKTAKNDGYDAVQLGFEEIKTKDPRTVEKRVKKPQLGHFKKAGIAPRRYLTECRVDSVEEYEVGQELGVDQFAEVKYVDATARSIGKGFQGVMKLHNFSGFPASHGTGPVHRHAGSTGMRSTPGRCFKGGKRASQMGNRQVTTQSLEVVMVQPEDNLIIVKGSVPGPKNGLVYLTEATKKTIKK